MNKSAVMAALALAASSPMMGGAEVVRREPGGGLGDWLRANGKIPPKGKRATQDVSRLLGRSFAKQPIYEPPGFFWKQDAGGTRWRLYRLPPRGNERTVVYDATHDRSIIRSAWGYVKPTYAYGDAR